MNYVKMFSTVLNNYDAKDKRSHGILKFFAEDLTDIEKTEFVLSIFDKGSWILATEISKMSESVNLLNNTKNKFQTIFNEWVRKRIEHSLIIPQNISNPTIPYTYIIEYKEALIAIKNLNFTDELLLICEKFLFECNPNYAKKFIENSFNLVIEAYSIDEIEFFFRYFLKLYRINNSTNFELFLNSFVKKLAYSSKIFDLSPSFINDLITISTLLKEKENTISYSNLISILLIELIKTKELDLSRSFYDSLIENTIHKLNKGEYENLELFTFLKKFKYEFKNIDFNLEIEFFFEKIKTNIYLSNNSNTTQKNNIIHHYLNSANQYFELFLFCLEYCSKEIIEEHIINFIKLIDELKTSFSTVLWFEDYLNHRKINGKITSVIKGGFKVKLDDDHFKNEVKNKQLESLYSDEFILKYGFGFLNINSLKDFPKAIKIYNSLQRNLNSHKTEISIDSLEIEEHDSFIISNVNYSRSNKGNVITLIPENNKLRRIISKYKLKSFFSSLDLFLIEKAYEYLHLESPFQNRKQLLEKLIDYKLNDDYKIFLSEEIFWNILEKLRPNIFEATYLKHKNDENLFNEILKAYESGIVVNGLVNHLTKGGMSIEVLGHEAFLPGSQIDIKPILNYEFYIGKTMELRIVKVLPQSKNIVVSRKVLIEEDVENQKKEIIRKLSKGLIFEGTVKNIASYGVFIDLGGVDGLIHINDLSWKRINHPSEVVKLEQVLNVVVIDFDVDKTRIQLGLKQLEPNPWDVLSDDLNVGDIVKGKIVEFEGFGLFIELANGIEGLVHISELSWELLPVEKKERNIYAQKLFAIGDNVEAIIMSFDRDERKISLSFKQLTQDPWTEIAEKYPIGSKHSGIVRNLTNFGVFLLLEEQIEGMIYISDLSWSKKFKHPSEFVNIGDKLDVVISEINVDERKLSLGHKQTTFNPWDQYEDLFTIGTIHSGKIIEIVNNGAKIEFDNDIIAFIHIKDIQDVKGKKLEKGESASFKVIEFNKLQKKIIVLLSNKRHSDIKANKIGQSMNSQLLYNKSSKNTNESIKVGSIVRGKVFEIADYGAYIEVIAGVESLVRVSEMSWNSTLCQAEDFMSVGDLIEAIVIGIDKFNHIIQLSTKQLVKDPWLDINDKLPIGSKHIGKVIRFVNFGVYIRLENNNIGYIANSNLSWYKKFKHPSEFVNIGDNLNVIILQMNSEERKINLGHKQTTIKS